MEDERVITELYRTGALTGRFLLRFMYLSASRSFRLLNSTMQSNTTQAPPIFTGETAWNEFVASSSKKELQELMTNEVNLQAFKEELERFGIGFAFQKQADGSTLLAYEFKNKAFVEKAFENVLKHFKTNTKQVNQRILKTRKNMDIAEKLTYYRRQLKDKADVKKLAEGVPTLKAPTPGKAEKTL